MTAVSEAKIVEPPAQPEAPAPKPRILVCTGSKKKCGGEAVFKGLTAQAEQLDIPVSIEQAKCGCTGECRRGPFLSFPDLHIFYGGVRENHIPHILSETVQKGKILFPLLYNNALQSLRTDMIWEKANSCLMTMDSNICMVQLAKYLIKFHSEESCGKCFPCRLGIQKLTELIEGITLGRGKSGDLEEAQSLIDLMKQAPYCSFAGKVSHIILAVLSHFKSEFEAHIKEKKCPAGICTLS
ncbi:MAG TPA: NADH-ubiquinone oxidoreductase-F iron-sulfur binding region domain-containing protein [Thermodesulfobacteriota bacterium]|nr:NADH-ubiquinone oxidoreductase-F iron-sulfur binding region domain-containing protein [Thermodesulfobacteriota bacterium]